MCISCISRITHLSFSGQNEILAVSASSMSTGAEKPVSCYGKPVTYLNQSFCSPDVAGM